MKKKVKKKNKKQKKKKTDYVVWLWSTSCARIQQCFDTSSDRKIV